VDQYLDTIDLTRKCNIREVLQRSYLYNC